MFSIEGENFVLDGKKVFLNSGEIHYFRIKKNLWDKHLAAAKEAGLTTISTYIPWAWHEPEEGHFDFDGHTIAERDLLGWIKKCREHGLLCTLKPGPFILAEYRGAGLPDWFLEQYVPEVKMHNSKGEPVNSDGVSLFHPVYLAKVDAWYKQIMPLISAHEYGKGGPVILMQICNEIGVFSWLSHQADYNEEVRKRFITYLKAKNSDINYWNRLWETGYTSFENIQLPPDGREPYQSVADKGRDYEWTLFWRKYYADYLRMLSKKARDLGVTLPFYHNLPGWIYGNGYEFPVNITMYEDLFEERSDIIFGVDHIPEFMSYRNLHDDRIINDITYAMQGKKPLFAAEFQSGSREYHVVTNPTEMELFYKASVANGLTGWNYYMFSQGRNPDRKGYSGSTFYWFNPLTPEAEKTSAFPLVQRMNKIIHTSESLIVEAKRKAEVAVLFYPPYYATELEKPIDAASNIVFNYSAIRRPAYFDGLLKALQVLNVDYDMIDLNKPATGWENYKQIWAFCTDEMNAEEQQKMIDYVKDGGNLVLYPNMPLREMNGQPCAIIRDAVQVQPVGTDAFDSALIDILGLKDIKCANPQMVYDANDLNEAEIIAKNIRDRITGFQKNIGKGKFIHVGTWWGFDTETHKDVYQQLLGLSDAKLSNATTDNFFIAVRERFTGGGQAMLFVANYYNEEHATSVTYTHPKTGTQVKMPLNKENIEVPGLYAILSPIGLNLNEDVQILHSTSDLLNISSIESGWELQVYGHRDLPGELVLEGAGVKNIKSIYCDNKQADILFVEDKLLVNYNHLHRKDFTIKIVNSK
ncbi:MAG: beta-galactosidase [Bacteroidetes bacterium]|nr:beta-galactosidase [Bacteroidota bacterium]